MLRPAPCGAKPKLVFVVSPSTIKIGSAIFKGIILGFGESIEVLEPNSLRNRIKQKLNKAAKQYTTR